MYCGKDGFWLIKCQGMELIERIKFNWIDLGSAKALKDFFYQNISNWSEISIICQKLNVKIADPLYCYESIGITTAFLGDGGTGRVVSVIDNDLLYNNIKKENLMALKCVKMENDTILITEYNFFKKHQSICNCNLIVHTVNNTSIERSDNLIGYLMTPVGLYHVKRNFAQNNIQLILKQLYLLHIHSKYPIIHHDPRLENLMVLNDNKNINNINFFWIDLMTISLFSYSNEMLQYGFKDDMIILITSIFPLLDFTSELLILIEYLINLNIQE